MIRINQIKLSFKSLFWSLILEDLIAILGIGPVFSEMPTVFKRLRWDVNWKMINEGHVFFIGSWWCINERPRWKKCKWVRAWILEIVLSNLYLVIQLSKKEQNVGFEVKRYQDKIYLKILVSIATLNYELEEHNLFSLTQ